MSTFTYTPSRKIINRLAKIRKAPYVKDREYNFALDLVGADNVAIFTLLHHFEEFELVTSKQHQNTIPVNGVKLPKVLFDEIEN